MALLPFHLIAKIATYSDRAATTAAFKCTNKDMNTESNYTDTQIRNIFVEKGKRLLTCWKNIELLRKKTSSRSWWEVDTVSEVNIALDFSAMLADLTDMDSQRTSFELEIGNRRIWISRNVSLNRDDIKVDQVYIGMFGKTSFLIKRVEGDTSFNIDWGSAQLDSSDFLGSLGLILMFSSVLKDVHRFQRGNIILERELNAYEMLMLTKFLGLCKMELSLQRVYDLKRHEYDIVSL